MRPWPLLLVPFLACASAAQKDTASKPTTGGTVTGHVYCADTNAPARLASVQLQPVKEAEKQPRDRARSSLINTPGGVAQTALDGSFVFSKVPPGAYYVLAAASGYLSPVPPDEDIDSAEPQPPAGQPPVVIPRVDVTVDQSASVDIRLERGASVTGTIRYDDGSPVSGVPVALLHKDSKGKWVRSPMALFAVRGNLNGITDDLGHYRISGVRDREYVLLITLYRLNLMAGLPHSGLRNSASSSLTVYSGDTTGRSDAVPFKLGPGEERTGEDVVIPLSRLHSVSGVVTAASDGHPISAGYVQVVTGEEGEEPIASSSVESDGSFHMDSVPEGSYRLRVREARDSTLQELSVPGKDTMTFLDEKVAHKYGELDQPIKIDGDLSNLVLAVPEAKTETKPGTKKPTAATQP